MPASYYLKTELGYTNLGSLPYIRVVNTQGAVIFIQLFKTAYCETTGATENQDRGWIQPWNAS